MKISELIDYLMRLKEGREDLDVWVNGEHGVNSPELLTEDQLSVGTAGLLFDTEYTSLADYDVIVHIGGA